MATTEEADVPPQTVTVADRLGRVWTEVTSEAPRKAVEAVTGQKGRDARLTLLLAVAAFLAGYVVGRG